MGEVFLDGRSQPEQLSLPEMELIARELTKVIGGELAISDIDRFGASDSAHGVFFVKATKGRAAGRAYAVKRHFLSEKAANELDMLSLTKGLGFNSVVPMTEKPIAVDGVAGKIIATEKVPSLALMTAVGWEKYYAGDEAYLDELTPLLGGIAEYAGRLHAHGVVHGDFKLKNIGTVPKGDIITFDLESASYHQDLDGSDFKIGCAKDLSSLVGSLVRENFLGTSSGRIFDAEIATHFLIPYIEASGMDFILEEPYYSTLSEYREYREKLVAA
ncbi:MAG TPA: hypothetical protein PKD19_01395 [Candidatus Saccharibacteria bacterium]|jgi:tRNA A-37 threonylcarbamoyl transferase component Bud32|nr:hypothetical protein [Candidatus Saccharibacteria bacterium]HMR37948.1 hypothetical protein [Candidatus Saccharibacteria bacterium]